jgi:NAD(P)-dependent dehydrogenase (short-subunit alcohol dehydrogenase family)
VHTGAVSSAVYSITKAAVTRMTEVHAVEWAAHRINVNAIAPGLFETEMSAGADPAQLATVAAGMRRGRVGQPGRLDSTLLYLVDPASDFVTGTCIKVDDAQMAR